MRLTCSPSRTFAWRRHETQLPASNGVAPLGLSVFCDRTQPLGLTPPGYIRSPLRGCKTVVLQAGHRVVVLTFEIRWPTNSRRHDARRDGGHRLNLHHRRIRYRNRPAASRTEGKKDAHTLQFTRRSFLFSPAAGEQPVIRRGRDLPRELCDAAADRRGPGGPLDVFLAGHSGHARAVG